ncbi:MAG: hypothetical protein A2Y76_09085 [Planctomycetes bacterium RBG_13_60_9]|nr:MAG: hypothetical protein A2Y76_09085 [Planctomycetes bacterium RBG_13_60_9]
MIPVQKEQTWLITVSLAILAVVALAVVLIYTRAVMMPFVVALFIVGLVAPIEDFQVKRLRLPRIIAVIVTLLVVLFVIALVSMLIAQATTTIVSTAGDYSRSFGDMAKKILQPIEEYFYKEDLLPKPLPAPNEPGSQAPAKVVGPVQSEPVLLELFSRVDDSNKPAVMDVKPQLDRPGVEDSNKVRDSNEAAVPGLEPNALAKKERPIGDIIGQIIKDLRNYIFNIVTNAFGTIFGLISSVFLVCIFVIFLLAGRNPYTEHSQVYKDVMQKIRRYVGTKVVISAATGVLVWASLTIIGLKLAGVFGVLAFLLNFIPSIGSIIATFLPIPIAVVQFQSSPWNIVLAVAIPGAIQNLLGNIIEPKIMGEGLNLHPVTVLLALSFWGLLWGVVGMFLAAPITAAIRIVLMQFDTFRPIANALAGNFTRQATPSSTPR